MPIVYLPTDSGLPSFTYGSGVTLSRFTNLKSLLKACLVTGAGSKAAAGWTLIDEGDYFIVLRNGSGYYMTLVSLGVLVAAANTAQARIYLHATYTGMASNSPTGLGVVSGIAAGNSAPHWWGSQNLWYHESTTKWLLVADADSFILTSVSTANSTPSSVSGTAFDTTSSPTSGVATLYVGNDLAGNFIAVGGNNNTIYGGALQFSASVMTTLYNPSTGLLVGGAGVAASVSGLDGAATFNAATVVEIGELELTQVRWVCDGMVQPALRGVRRDAALTRMYSSTAKNSIEQTNVAHTISNVLIPAVQADGYMYQPLLANQADRCQVFVTDNPECW